MVNAVIRKTKLRHKIHTNTNLCPEKTMASAMELFLGSFRSGVLNSALT